MYPKELTENHQKGSNSNSRALHDHEKSQLLISGSPKNLFELTNPKKIREFVRFGHSSLMTSWEHIITFAEWNIESNRSGGYGIDV